MEVNRKSQQLFSSHKIVENYGGLTEVWRFNRAPEIRKSIEDKSKIIFSYFSTKTYVVTPH